MSEEYTRVFFPLDMIPIQDLSKTIQLMNWADAVGIDIVHAVTAPAMVGPQGLALPNGARQGMVTLQFFYGAVDEEKDFMEIFGFPYAVEKVHKIPEFIQREVYQAAGE